MMMLPSSSSSTEFADWTYHECSRTLRLLVYLLAGLHSLRRTFGIAYDEPSRGRFGRINIPHACAVVFCGPLWMPYLREAHDCL